MMNDETDLDERAQASRQLNATLSIRKLGALIDQTNLSADLKALLMDLARVTITVGSTAVAIGRKILSVVFEIATTYPKTTFCVVVAVAVTLLVGSVPLVGPLLTPFVGPLLIAAGLTFGAIADMRAAEWASRITVLERQLATVAA